MSFSETTQIREPAAEPEADDGIRKFSTTSSGDEAFEKLEIKRRLTIVPPGTFLGDEDQDDENLDIAYDDELIYDDEDPEQDLEGDEYYERYSDEEEVSEQVNDHLIAEPKTLEDLNALYQPKFEEKLTTIESRFQAPSEMLAPQSHSRTTPPTRSSPQPPPQQPQETVIPTSKVPVMEKKSSPTLPAASPLDPRKSSPIPAEIKLETGTVVAAPSRHPDEEYDDEEYSDELYEEEEEEESVGSDIDDDDLMRRLEAKYGKLPQQLEGGEEQDFLGESDLEEEEDDDDDPSWTSKVK